MNKEVEGMISWTEAHITKHPLTKEYTGWDETGTWVVATSFNKVEVIMALEEYAKTLDRRPNALDIQEWERAYFNEAR